MKKLLAFGPLFIILAAFLWSLDGLLRVSLYSLPPIVVVFWEHFIGFLILLPVLLPKWKEVASIKPRVWGAFAWVTVLSSILGARALYGGTGESELYSIFRRGTASANAALVCRAVWPFDIKGAH